MMIIGYLITFASLYLLYMGEILIGSIIFVVGGVLAKKLFLCIRSCGVLLMVSSIAYGYHNQYSPLIFFLIFVGFVMACFNTHPHCTSQSYDGGGWGIDLDMFGSDSSGGGDFGGGGD